MLQTAMPHLCYTEDMPLKKILVSGLCFCVLSSWNGPNAEARNILHLLTQSSHAIVSIVAENAVIHGSKPKAMLMKETGQVVVQKQVKPVKYTRTGTGIIVKSDGIIIANAHTVAQAARVTIILFNQTKYIAKILHIIPGQDLAILQIQPKSPLPALAFTDSDKIKLRNKVYSVGGSALLKNTISEGKISGIGKNKRLRNAKGNKAVGMIEVNFDLYHGDSGSPIFNEEGLVLGIITATHTNKHKKTYAIPSNMIVKSIKDYITAMKMQAAG